METIITGLTKDVIKSLGELAINEIAKVLNVKNEINKLTRKLGNITATIKDAEQTVVQNETTRDWLKQLKEITYEAENIIDRCKIEEERLRMLRTQESNALLAFQCCRDYAIDYKIANDIRKLNNKMDIVLENEPHNLRPATEDYTRLNRDVSPYIDADIVGREVENDSDNLIQLLQRDHVDDCLLFAVVGTIGVGKTTLARKIYHKTVSMFPSRLWVHVSKDLSYITMWADEECTQAKADVQLPRLRRFLEGQKFLLVIDDVWTEKVWDELLETQAQHCTPGSRVLITTRHDRVAKRVGATYVHRVKRLNEDDGWWLLHTRALLLESTGNTQEIGRRIVQKCNGLPMAIRRIGCHLRDVVDREDDWERLYSSDLCRISREIWTSINISYMELPYYLKRCLLYCSLYPDGFVIDQQCITQQWIAEGFIAAQPNSTLEEGAEKCYEELIQRSLLLPENEAGGAVGSKMPHLFRSFALGMSQDEIITGNLQDISDVYQPWRLSITNGDAEPIQNDIKKLKSLRTLLLFGSPLNDRALDDILQRLTHLRVLDLGAAQIECVTASLGRLVHLRYLSLSNTKVRDLPVTIENLRMLQFLILKSCSRLNSLPECVGRLTNLRSLDISGTELKKVPFRLSMMKELNCMQGFLLSREQNSGWAFDELSELPKLTSLQILRLERALNKEDASRSILHNKQNLKELELCCSTDDRSTEIGKDVETIKSVFEALKPPKRLVSLKLANYYGHEFPCWMSASHLTQLQRLILDGCFHCQHLPSLGEMKNLKFLAITGSNVLSDNGPQLRGTPDDGVAFPKLEQLLISQMFNLESWWDLEQRDMPLLLSFQLEGCLKLKSLPYWLKHHTALMSLHIHHADSLEAIENLPMLKELEVHEDQMLERISNLKSLEDLRVVHCSLLKVVQNVPSLRSVHLDERTIRLPQWLQQQAFPLRRLEIIGTEELLDKCSFASAPYWSIIQHADHVYTKLPDGSFYFSYTKRNSSFHRSQRSLARSFLYNSPSFTVPVVPQTNDVILEDQIRNMNSQKNWATSIGWIRNELFVILLYVVAQYLFLLSSRPE